MSLCFVSCQSSLNEELKPLVEVHKTAKDDPQYSSILQKSTRKVEVYDNLEAKVFINATYFSPSFRKGLKNRFKNIFGKEQTLLVKDEKQIVFLVSVFTPKRKNINLNDQHLWSLYIKNSKEKYKPKMVKFINQKEKLNPFFPYINNWSKEYMIFFPNNLTKNERKNLVLSNSQVRIELFWDEV